MHNVYDMHAKISPQWLRFQRSGISCMLPGRDMTACFQVVIWLKLRLSDVNPQTIQINIMTLTFDLPKK